MLVAPQRFEYLTMKSKLPPIRIYQQHEPRAFVRGLICGAIGVLLLWGVLEMFYPRPTQAVVPRLEPADVYSRIQAVNEKLTRLERRREVPCPQIPQILSLGK